MNNTSKSIRLSQHAKIRSESRGTAEEEIVETIRSAEWKKSELDKLECRKDFTFNKKWGGKLYKTKQIRPIFVEENNEIVVVTVYVYYF